MMGIGARLRLNVLLPVVIALLVTSLVAYASVEVYAAHERNEQVRDLASAVLELGLLTHSYLLAPNERKRSQWLSQFDELRARLAGLAAGTASPPQARARLVLADIRELYAALMQTEQHRAAGAAITPLQRLLEGQLRVAIRKLATEVRLLARDSAARERGMLAGASALVVAITLLTALASALMLRKVNSAIVEGMDRLERGMREVGGGNLEYRVAQHGPAEVAELAHSFNAMSARLLSITVARDRLAAEVEERSRAEAALREAEQRFRQALMLAPLPIMVHAEDGEVVMVNRAWEESTGYTLEEIPTMEAWIRHAFVGAASNLMAELRQLYGIRERVTNGEFVIRTRGGKQCTWLFSSAPLGRMPDGRRLVISMAQDITERKSMESAIAFQARHDALTGLPNRALFMDLMEQELALARRNRHRAAVLFLDLDRFKHVNDALGHETGDALLREVARRLRASVRDSDTVARIGGDEFNVLMPFIQHSDDVARVADKVLASFDSPFLVHGHAIYSSTSIGIGIYPDDGGDPDALLRSADLAMYHAKQHGRNRFNFYEPALNARVDRRLDLERELRRALERDELEVHYLPQQDLASGAIVAVEALVRWRHPQRGLLGPGEFLPVAEDSGLILALGERVMLMACTALAQREQGAPIQLSVNLSQREFLHPSLVERIFAILAETGLDPGRLDLEVSEDTLMRELDVMQPRLHRLAEAGVSVAVDNFGAGCSSLNWLHRLPIRHVKVDRSFVQELSLRPDDTGVVDAMVSLAHTLGKRVCAGGVETELQRRILADHGCDQIQGRLVGAPAPNLAW